MPVPQTRSDRYGFDVKNAFVIQILELLPRSLPHKTNLPVSLAAATPPAACIGKVVGHSQVTGLDHSTTF